MGCCIPCVNYAVAGLIFVLFILTHLSELTAEQYVAIRLKRYSENRPVGAFTRIEVPIELAAIVQTGVAISRVSTYLGEFATNNDLAIRKRTKIKDRAVDADG